MRKHQCETRPFLQRVNVAFARANLNERIWLFQLSHQKHKLLQMYKHTHFKLYASFTELPSVCVALLIIFDFFERKVPDVLLNYY